MTHTIEKLEKLFEKFTDSELIAVLLSRGFVLDNIPHISMLDDAISTLIKEGIVDEDYVMNNETKRLFFVNFKSNADEKLETTILNKLRDEILGKTS